MIVTAMFLKRHTDLVSLYNRRRMKGVVNDILERQ